MARMRGAVLLLLGSVPALLVATTGPSFGPEGEQLGGLEAFEDDNECANSELGGSACAVSALQHRAIGVSEKTSAGSNANTSTQGHLPEYTTSCYGFTGGTCLASECNTDRGAACENGLCVCETGECTGPDGKCYKQSNVEIAQGFRLYNAKYTAYKMYFQSISAFGQLKTTRMPNWSNFGKDEFTLHRVPGNRTVFILGSMKWAQYAVAMRPTTGSALSPFAAYAVSLHGQIVPWNPDTIMLQVCSLTRRGYPGHVMIGSIGAHGIPVWAYIHHGSYFVYGSVTPPGLGGYWRVDPALPEGMLPDCDA